MACIFAVITITQINKSTENILQVVESGNINTVSLNVDLNSLQYFLNSFSETNQSLYFC